MKSYKDYEKEFNDIYSVIRRIQTKYPLDYEVQKDVWICAKWQEENNFNPWNPNAAQQLEQLKLTDEALFNSVIFGLDVFFQVMKGKN